MKTSVQPAVRVIWGLAQIAFRARVRSISIVTKNNNVLCYPMICLVVQPELPAIHGCSLLTTLYLANVLLNCVIVLLLRRCCTMCTLIPCDQHYEGRNSCFCLRPHKRRDLIRVRIVKSSLLRLFLSYSDIKNIGWGSKILSVRIFLA